MSVTEACPSRSLTIFGCLPAASSNVAQVCLKIVNPNSLKPRGLKDGMEMPARDAGKIQGRPLSRAEDEALVLVSRAEL